MRTPLENLSLRDQLRVDRLPARLALLMVGLTGFGLSLALLLRSGLGGAPWDVLHAALAERIQGLSGPATSQRAAPAGRDNVAAIVQALTAGRSANHSAKQSLNAARRNLDDDLFAA